MLCGDTAPVSVSAWYVLATGNNPVRPDVFRVRRAKMSGHVGLFPVARTLHAETDTGAVSPHEPCITSVSACLGGATGQSLPLGGEIRGRQEFACFRRAGGQGRPPPVLGLGQRLDHRFLPAHREFQREQRGSSGARAASATGARTAESERAALKAWCPLQSPHAPTQSANLTAVGIWIISDG